MAIDTIEIINKWKNNSILRITIQGKGRGQEVLLASMDWKRAQNLIENIEADDSGAAEDLHPSWSQSGPASRNQGAERPAQMPWQESKLGGLVRTDLDKPAC